MSSKLIVGHHNFEAFLTSVHFFISLFLTPYVTLDVGVVSGSRGAFYSICCLGFLAIFELR